MQTSTRVLVIRKLRGFTLSHCLSYNGSLAAIAKTELNHNTVIGLFLSENMWFLAYFAGDRHKREGIFISSILSYVMNAGTRCTGLRKSP